MLPVRRSSIRALLAGALAAAACARPGAPPAPTPAAAISGEPAIRLEHDARRRALIVVAGPFTISAHAAAEEHHSEGIDLEKDFSPLVTVEWPESGWLHGFRFELVDAAGAPLPKSLLHHMIAHNLDRRELVYPVVGRLFGVGTETADVTLPRSVGVPLEGGHRVALYAMWHNQTGREVRGVYVRLSLPWTPAASGARPLSALPIYMDVNFRTNHTTAFDLQPGRSEHSYEFTVPLSGGVLGIGGHLHEHGRSVRVEDAETGRVLMRVRGRYDRAGRLSGVERKVFRSWFGLKDARIRLEAGRRYRVVGEYFNPGGEVIRLGGMAHIVGLFVPEDLGAWPALDAADPAYRDDIAWLNSLGKPAAHSHDDHDH
jgi:hypothetical protein